MVLNKVLNIIENRINEYISKANKAADSNPELCEELNNCNIKFAMSNVFSNKGITNEKLIEWCKKNNWSVHYFDNFTYSACGKGNGKTVEVLIMNY